MKNAFKPATGTFERPTRSQQKRHKAQKVVSNLPTPEEIAKIVAAQQQAAADEKAERERIELYGKSVRKMSHRQLRGELHRAVRREYSGKPAEPQAGLNICLASIFLTVLENTKTSEIFETHEDGTPKRVARHDQINPKFNLHAYPV